MSYHNDLALRFALLKVLMGELGDAKSAADCEIRDTWHPGDRNTATLPGKVLLGAVTFAKGKTTSQLVDEPAFTAWVEKVHPEQMETVTITRVRPGYRERLMSAARRLGEAVDGETGEAVPGITVVQGEPYPMVKLAPDARDAVVRAWRAGELRELVGALLAIEGSDRHG